jgi:hypothetical protein
MEDVQQPGRLPKQSGIPKEEILLTRKVTRIGWNRMMIRKLR